MAVVIEDWTFYGVHWQKTDSIYGIVKNAVKENLLSQEYLQKTLGYMAPIVVDHEKKVVDFFKW